MKNKTLTFLCSVGIPFSALSAQRGCTGICGSCQLNCAPGLLMLLFLTGKYLLSKYVWKCAKL